MPITLLDGILVGFTLVSALLAMVRGFSREVLSIASWIAAAAAAYFFWRPVVPYVETYVRPYSDDPRAAIFVAAAIVFVIALIIVTLITMKIADAIIDSRIGALDRTLGFLYGAARGILVVAVCLMLFDWIVGDKRPDWVAKAKSAPMLDKVSVLDRRQIARGRQQRHVGEDHSERSRSGTAGDPRCSGTGFTGRQCAGRKSTCRDSAGKQLTVARQGPALYIPFF